MAATLTAPQTDNPVRERMTYEEFLEHDWPNPHVEWVEGEVLEMSPVGLVHNTLDRWLMMVLGYYIEEHGGAIQHDPFQMRCLPDGPGRAPDILYVAKENIHRLRPTFLEGPADVAVEIISPKSAAIDRGEKYFEYENGGVKEYWLIDPSRKRAEFYRLGRDGMYELTLQEDGLFRSEVMPSFWIKVEWLWDMPAVLSVLKQWGMIG